MEEARNFIIDFLSVFYEAMPFIVLGAVISGMLEELVPQTFFARIIPKNRVVAICISALLGIIFPMCECGIVPIMRRLLRKGMPLGCAIAYMLVGPIINVVVFMSTLMAFRKHWDKGGIEIIWMRMVMGYIVGVSTALIVERMHRKYGNDLLTDSTRPDSGKGHSLPVLDADEIPGKPAVKAPRASIMKRLGNISEAALHDFMDITIFLTLGAVLASLTKQVLNPGQVANFSNSYPPLAIAALMGLGILMCICSEADAFIAASFTDLHPSAKLAFLVLGPMFDLKLLMMYTRVFKPRLIVAIVSALLIQIFLLSVIVHYLWNVFGFPSPLHPIVAGSSS